MTFPPAKATICELTDKPTRDRFLDLPLKTYIPSRYTFSSPAKALLVPEALEILIGPLSCLFHRSFCVRESGRKNRLFLYPLDEIDFSLGQYVEYLKDEIDQILMREKPKALILCYTCVDHLIATDFSPLINDLSKRFQIPITLTQTGSLCSKNRVSATKRSYQMMVDFFDTSTQQSHQVNLVGHMNPLSPSSELIELVTQTGWSIHQLPEATTFKDFQKMGRASSNILLSKDASLLAAAMAERFATPFCTTEEAFSLFQIEENYKDIEKLLNTKIDYEPKREQTLENIQPILSSIGSASLAVGSSINGEPLELARLLVELGLQVKAVFIKAIGDQDLIHLNWLSKRSPNIMIYHRQNPLLVDCKSELGSIDISIGKDAALYSNGALAIDLKQKEVFFGYEKTVELFKKINAVMLQAT